MNQDQNKRRNLVFLQVTRYPHKELPEGGFSVLFNLTELSDTILRMTRDSKINYILGAILFVSLFALYFYTAAPGVYDGDSGELAAAVNTLGLAHPTGFPLYMLLGKLFTLILPIGDIAYRLNIFSALLTAGALVFVYYTLRNLGISTFSALVSSVVLGLGRNTIWANSGRVGVYPLSLLFVAILFFIYSKWRKQPKTEHLYLYGLLWGLSLGTHALMLTMGIPFLFMLWQARSFLKSHISVLFKTAIVTVLPGLQYLYLLFAYKRNGIATWGSMSSFHDFSYYITQKQYSFKFFGYFSSGETWAFFSRISYIYSRELSLIFFIISILGLIIMLKRQRLLGILLCIITIANIAMMFSYGIHDNDLQILQRYIFLVYLTQALFIAFGLEQFIRWLRKARIKYHIILVLIISVILLGVQLKFAYSQNNRRSISLVEDTGNFILNSTEPNALILASGDIFINPVVYLQSIGKRSDVTIVSVNMIVFRWYVEHLITAYPSVAGNDLLQVKNQDKITQIINDNISNRPVYIIGFNSTADGDLVKRYEFIPHGLLFQIVPRDQSTNRDAVANNDKIWQKFNLSSVRTVENYHDFMLNDLAKYYAFMLYQSGIAYENHGFRVLAVKSFQGALNIFPADVIKSKLDQVQKD